jgi:hypothetical protein
MISRRRFLRSLSSVPVALAFHGGRATALANSVLKSVEVRTGARPSHSALDSLPPGAIRPEGWLGLYLDKQAKGLSLHLPEVARPFTGAFWAGEENYASWWPWEQKGYWTDGALRCALVTGNQELLKVARVPVDYTLSHSFPDGYLGPALIRNGKEDDPRVDNFRWPNTVFFRAVMAKAEATNDPTIAVAIQKHYLSNQSAPYGGPSRDVTNVEPMLWAYARTRDERLLNMAEKAWAGFLESAEPGDFESGDLHPDRVFANTPINAHGVTYIEKAKLPAILYMHTGKEEYLPYALAAQKRIFDHHMLVDGIPSTTEDYRGITALDSHETCDISDHTWTWGYLLMATGAGVWADRIERAIFNAGFGAIKKDWKAHQYFSCPNQFLATQNSCHAVLAHGKSWMSYRPGHTVACCSGNVHRIFPNYAIRMWMQDAKRGLAAVLYGPSSVTAQVSQGRHRVEIKQETNYPFEEEIHFTISCEQPLTFPLSFRIPGWCSSPHFYLNDKPLLLPPVDNGFAQLNRKFHPNDRITLVLPMRTALSHWPDNGVGVEHGPLVYSLPIKEEWTSVVIPKYSTSQFPCWNAMPASPWGYGLAVGELQLASEIEIKRKPMAEDPWTEPPITMTVLLKKIAGWELAVDEKDANQKFTPPLPDVNKSSLAAETESISLVPYGSTHLRLTIFPGVSNAGDSTKAAKPA